MGFMEIFILFLAVTFLEVHGGANTGITPDATDYLAKFGYGGASNPNPRMASLTDPNVVRTALMNFQEMAGIPKTGVFDDQTKTMMAMPRCGVKDIQNMGDDADAKRKKRYAVQGSKWRNKAITYRITGYTPDLNRVHVEEELRRAFKVWSDVTDLKFAKRTSGTPDIEIYFARGSHGDGSPFDGQGGTLAHAYFPEFGGDAHFDDDETYSFNVSRSGTVNLFQVAAHEFGHSLGLGHSKINSALMAPFYRGYQRLFKLDQDDIDGIQKIYGRPNIRPPANTPAPTPEPTAPVKTDAPMPTPGVIPRKCDVSRVDAFLNLETNDRAYLFSGEYYWRINTGGVDEGYPKMITRYWGGIPGNIDAAFNLVDRSGVIYFFKGNQFWRFKGGQRQPGYPKYIGYDGFYGLKNVKIDAAFVWSGNGRIYIISGSKYYRLGRQTYDKPHPEQRRVDAGYPRDLYLWRGVPRNIGAAFQYRNGRTYFFNKNNLEYSRFNDRNFAVDTDYPRSTTEWWLGCAKSGISQPDHDKEEDTGADMKIIDNEDSDKNLGDVYDNGSVNILVSTFTIVLTFITSLLFS